MRIGVLGTGSVGRTLGTGLIRAGHQVRLGSRTAENEAAMTWATEHGVDATHGTFAEAAAFGDLVVNATAGRSSLEALAAAGAEHLAAKILIDVANPLDFSAGELRFTVANEDSLAERIQRTLPETRVVKALNMVNAAVMTEPVPDSTLFVCGNDDGAKKDVIELVRAFGWEDVIDLGDLSAARGMEMYLALWLRTMNALGTPRFNVKIVR